MDSSLHMHVASLKIQDEIRRGATARLAKQAQQESRAAAKTTGWVTLRRLFVPSLRRAY
jgi:hypothetical protein